MGKHVVFGAGAIGRGVAQELVERGEQVVLASRSGTGPTVTGARRVAVDASDAQAVLGVTDAAVAIYNCLNPPYNRWPTDWPPMADNLLRAAEAAGAVLVTVSNLYGYGPVSGPITESLPLSAPGPKGRVRAKMFADALAAHHQGRIRMVEVRASDYVGPGAESVLGERLVPRLLAGKSVSVIGDPDVDHTFTFTGDVSLLAVATAFDPDAWGRAWHVPSNPALTQRQAITDLASAADLATPRIRVIPNVLLRSVGLFNPVVRELQETRYQFVAPFVLDSSDAQEHFGMTPTTWNQVLTRTLDSYREPVSSASGAPTGR